MPTDFAMLEELINRKSAAESKNLDNLCLAEIEDAVAGKLLDALFYMKKILENTTGEDKSYTEEILYKLSEVASMLSESAFITACEVAEGATIKVTKFKYEGRDCFQYETS